MTEQLVARLRNIIQQYEEGAITAVEMANAIVASTLDVYDKLPRTEWELDNATEEKG